jgi:hypothetical protein
MKLQGRRCFDASTSSATAEFSRPCRGASFQSSSRKLRPQVACFAENQKNDEAALVMSGLREYFVRISLNDKAFAVGQMLFKNQA